MNVEKTIVFTNIPWTQVVLAICALTATIVTLITVFHRLATASIRKDLSIVKRMLRSLNRKVKIQNGRVTKLEGRNQERDA